MKRVITAPLPFSLQLVVDEDAEADLAEFGRVYWDVLGVDEVSRQTMWRWSLTDLHREHGVPIRRAHILAAAGVVAQIPGLTCPACAGPMTFRARDDLERYLRDETVHRCTGCDTTLQRAMAAERTPEAGRRRAEQRRRAQHDLAVHRAQMAWEQARRAHVAAGHPLAEPSPDGPRRGSTMLADLVTLTLLRHRPSEPVVAPVNTWSRPLAPTATMSELALNECLHHGLLRVHPESPARVCRWRETFTAALDRADGDPSLVGQPMCDGYALDWVAWWLPVADGDAAAGQRLETELSARFALDRLSAADRAALRDTAVVLIAAETVHAFEAGLRAGDLPGVPDRHRPTLQAAALQLARLNDLDACLALADAAVHGAVKAASANPQASRVNMSVHGVNRLTDSAETWYVLPTYDPMQPDQTRRDRSRRDRLSALTWVLFRGVLGIDPLTASRVLTTSILAVNNQDAATGQTTTANTSPQEPELDRQVRVVLTADPERVHQALRACADHQNPVIAVAAESLLQVVNQIHTATGDLRGALVAAVAATRLLRSPLVLPRTVSTAGVGEYLADAMTEPADNRSNGRDPA